MMQDLAKLNNPLLERPSKMKMLEEYAEDTLTKYIPDQQDQIYAKNHKDS
jgi:hypothetical protein